MLGPWRTHAQFRIWLETQLAAHLPQFKSLIEFHADILEKVYVLDLDPLRDLIAPYYTIRLLAGRL